MSKKTRTNRPTTATPRKLNRGRMFHTSTDYGWVPAHPMYPLGAQKFVKLGPGRTYREKDLF